MKLCWSARLLAQEAAQPDSILGGLFQRAGQPHRPFARAHHHHVMRRGEFAADHAHNPAGRQPEQQQQNPGITGEEEDERAAQVQPEYVLKDHQAQSAIRALPGRIAQNQARVA